MEKNKKGQLGKLQNLLNGLEENCKIEKKLIHKII
jgi:hypothetical protein